MRTGTLRGKRQSYMNLPIYWNLERDSTTLGKMEDLCKKYDISVSKFIRKATRYFVDQFEVEERRDEVKDEIYGEES